MKGWIKLHREIMEHWVYEDPLLLKMWITVLLMANHEEKKICINNEPLTIHRGQFWTSIRKLATTTGMSKNTAERKLFLLQSDGMIFVEPRPGVGTLVTVRNYAVYQDFPSTYGDTSWDTSWDTHWDKVGTHSGTLIDHKQEVKNDKELFKNKRNNGLPPDDPNYFEEV